ncbi:D-alanyl-D-alanine carboxypeptidase/D-alanyl-D-alanine endopeptidase [Sanguibacter suaedae]|uniref:D-alanyl-D-alanine carboxypeptidase/D-alanyl-D-alanine-endopeptidase n=1 Tax=Sanguibacter suaedae TaxID=2795737 RepID=A0A934MF22_9MICO|nr:D-alanyl-D-alanine carboxypeptidase/D-alanyl-D-alanine-endopeptidase [Sanguibacter suaedae]MBI9116219.1 D-alanyl-D-alanine carboxypeptidase/D-alanyl-D-alanine-endopeptidase [Sanguibacter suaedae]
MGLMARVVGVTVASALVVAGGYVWADAHDIVPGVLTLGPEPAPPAPFPTAPGAATGPDPADTLSVLDPEALAPTPAVLQQRVDALVADPRLGPSVGVVVADALTGDVLASADPDRPRTPASIQKMLTATAALSALGPDHVLETTVVQTGEGKIALVGGGDMMLAAGAGDANAVNGHAGMADLAAQVAKELALAGRTTVTLTLDDTLFTGDPMGPWSPDQPTLGYAAPVAAVAVDTGRTGPGIYAQRHADPAMVAAQELARALAAEGITVEGEPTRAAAAADARVIGTVASAPLGEIVEYLLQTSDNTITEVVARAVAVDADLPASFAGSTKAVLAELGTLGLDVSDAVLVDASGLGAGSSVPASLFAEVLELVSDPANVELRAAATDLPVSGLQGTLAERFLSSPARGLVRAKTGSLPQVTSLAGTVVTADGRLLTFVVMADQTPEGGQWAPRQAIDGFVTDLALCGCR